ncbi:hypothetical protein [Namhaeicola litoreus]|uniref:Uncharacterized protein n=1 Tax=Namhaeicola litoreus TaxID=1052145 RepID=A0ABW3XZ05_9FLAO
MSNRRIRLIWDFRGHDAQQIAEHHCIHLEEFREKSSVRIEEIRSQFIEEFYSTASLVVNESDMMAVRDALRPHRGEVAKPNDEK